MLLRNAEESFQGGEILEYLAKSVADVIAQNFVRIIIVSI